MNRYDDAMTTNPSNNLPPQAVLTEYGLEGASLTQITTGHINLTFQATLADQTTFIVQRVNPMFDTAVQHDIAAVSTHLRTAGIATIELMPTPKAEPFLIMNNDLWRVLRYIPGETHESVPDADHAFEAGRILGVFHRGVADYAHPLQNSRPNIHDHVLHQTTLEQSIHSCQDHRYIKNISRLAGEIRAAFKAVGTYAIGPTQLVHGDAKISNIIFDDGQAVCMIDLDTLNRIPVLHELGDALRSWCNETAEDSADSAIASANLHAAAEGYRVAGGRWPAGSDVVSAIAAIAVELAARFCSDALHESYFGWDTQRFESASHHNQARANAQLQLALNILQRRKELENAIKTPNL